MTPSSTSELEVRSNIAPTPWIGDALRWHLKLEFIHFRFAPSRCHAPALRQDFDQNQARIGRTPQKMLVQWQEAGGVPESPGLFISLVQLRG